MKHLYYIILCLGILACAKERSEEPVGDADVQDKRFLKSIFTDNSSKEDAESSDLVAQKSPKKWFFKRTLVNSTDNSPISFTGFQHNMQIGTFEITEEELRFNKAVTMYGDAQNTLSKPILSWNIKHSEYRLAESDGKVSNKQEENKHISWDEKNHLVIDFSDMNSTLPVTAYIMPKVDPSCFSIMQNTARVVEGSQVVQDEHIAFTMSIDYAFHTEECLSFQTIREYLNGEDYVTVEVRFSFKPVHAVASKDYQPYLYDGEFDPLNSKYGYFQTRVERQDPENIFRNDFFMNRWNPNRGEDNPHQFYFARDFPEKYKWIYSDPETGIIARTNQLFERNGLPTRFAIGEAPDDVHFGDVGTSFIKFVPELDFVAPLGYGPSDANPLTGEIISANTIIWGGLLEHYIKRIKVELEVEENAKLGDDEDGHDRLTRFGDSDLYRKIRETLNVNNEQLAKATPEQKNKLLNTGEYMDKWVETSEALNPGTDAGDAFAFLLPEFTFGPFGYKHAYHEAGAFASESAKEFNASLDEQFFNYSRFEDAWELLGSNGKRSYAPIVDQMQIGIQQYFQESFSLQNLHHQSTIYRMEEPVAQAHKAMIEGKTEQEVLNTILYRVAIHEFGHNLNLRHNFYGSVDEKHFREPIDGKVQNTSSVMDYKDLTDEIHDIHDWEAYDEAALVYAYSGGKIDLAKENNTSYLYCTDEHRLLNAMCGAWDRGTTPSEVALSIIKRYEARYWMRNYRFDRPFWYTGGYIESIFQDMWDLKKFLAFHNQAFEFTEIRNKLMESKWRPLIDRELLEPEVVDPIRRDLKQANLLVAAFYHALIQQKNQDRPWLDVYDDFTGALERKGILYDKVYALFFLIGDATFPYDFNEAMAPLSFLELINDGYIGNTINDIVKKTVTEQIAAQQGFESLARSFYVLNANNYLNRINNGALVQKVRVECYGLDSLKAKLGIDPYETLPNGEKKRLDAITVKNQIANATNPDYYFMDSPGEQVSLAYIDGNYYAAMEVKNEYAFSLINTMRWHPYNGYRRDEIVELYRMYHEETKGFVPQCQ